MKIKTMCIFKWIWSANVECVFDRKKIHLIISGSIFCAHSQIIVGMTPSKIQMACDLIDCERYSFQQITSFQFCSIILTVGQKFELKLVLSIPFSIAKQNSVMITREKKNLQIYFNRNKECVV